MLHFPAYRDHFNLLTVKHVRKRSASQLQKMGNALPSASGRRPGPQFIRSPVSSLFAAHLRFRFPSSSSCQVYSSSCHRISTRSFFCCFTPIYYTPLLPARRNPERKLDTLSSDTCQSPPKRKQSPSPRSCNKDRNRSLHKRGS